jgi:hypothetical protein
MPRDDRVVTQQIAAGGVAAQRTSLPARNDCSRPFIADPDIGRHTHVGVLGLADGTGEVHPVHDTRTDVASVAVIAQRDLPGASGVHEVR